MVNVAIEAALALAVVGVVLTLIWMINVLDEIMGVMRGTLKVMFGEVIHLESIDKMLEKMDGGIDGIGNRMQYWIDRDKVVQGDEQNV